MHFHGNINFSCYQRHAFQLFLRESRLDAAPVVVVVTVVVVVVVVAVVNVILFNEMFF